MPSVAERNRYDSLDQLLSDYRRSGVDSEGQFTLNPSRAREMLEQFQLPEPAHYALHLVSFLVGAGAASVRFDSTTDGIRFLGVRACIAASERVSPFSALLRSDVDPYLSELALGLNALLGMGGLAELHSSDGMVRYGPDRFESCEDQACHDGLLLVVRGAGNGEREKQLIAEHLALCPIPLELDGRELAKPSWTRATLQVALCNPRYPLPEIPAAPVEIRREIQAPFSAVLRLGRESSGVRLLQLGRLYLAAAPWRCQLPGWQVEIVVNSDCFRKDLSQQSIRVDRLYQNLFEALRQQLEKALLSFPIGPGWDDEVEALWDDATGELFRKGRAHAALERQSLLVKHLEHAPDSPTKGNALHRLGQLLDSVQPGKGRRYSELGKEILAQHCPPSEANLRLLKASMAYSAGPELESAVRAMSQDQQACPEDRLRCLLWLRDHRSEASPSTYHLEIAQLLYQLRRPGLALAELDAHPMEDGRMEAGELELRAGIYADLGQPERAVECLGRLLALQREQHGQYSLKLGMTLSALVALLEHLGQNRQAREYRDWSRRLHQ